jgi:ABC-2 type transport system ATP-binding protein
MTQTESRAQHERIVFSADRLSKRFDERVALDQITCCVPRGRVVGLIGRNGSGKTTLLRCLQGLAAPTAGCASTFGIDGMALGDAELARIGVVHQANRFVPWMSGRSHLDFVRSFYERWDRERERKLVDAFELDLRQRIGSMSPGSIQKLAIITATCHHPEAILLDEPAAALDPPSREALYATLFELLREDEPAIIISSHQLDDIERSVDWILCLEQGRVVRDEALDTLQERYARWRVLPLPGSFSDSVRSGGLPAGFREPWIKSAVVEERGALLVVEDAEAKREAFETRHGVTVDSQPLRLAEMFKVWMNERASDDRTRGTAVAMPKESLR